MLTLANGFIRYVPPDFTVHHLLKLNDNSLLVTILRLGLHVNFALQREKFHVIVNMIRSVLGV